MIHPNEMLTSTSDIKDRIENLCKRVIFFIKDLSLICSVKAYPKKEILQETLDLNKGEEYFRKMNNTKLGSFELISLSDGIMRLDGGAMFGVVPKVFWEKIFPPDKLNRIVIGVNPLLIKADGCNILVDTGNGDKFSEKLMKIYGIEREPTLIDSLSDAGLKPDDIDVVINTHLHFDHCGGNTFVDRDGKLRPTFPKARYIVQRAEWDDATNTHELSKASYLAENFAPLMEAGVVDLVDGDKEIYSGITLVRTPGHNRGHQSVKIESEGKTAFFLGDLIPTSAHIPLPYIMSYDLYPMELLEVKRRILREALEKHWLLIFEHDTKVRMVYLKEVEGKMTVEAV